MADKLYVVGNGSLIDIADAIREKNPAISGGLTVADMPRAIRDIPVGGGNSPYTKTEYPLSSERTIVHAMDFTDTYFFMELNMWDTEDQEEYLDRGLIHVTDGKWFSNTCDLSINYGGTDYTVTIAPKTGFEFRTVAVTEFTLRSDLPQDEHGFFEILPSINY